MALVDISAHGKQILEAINRYGFMSTSQVKQLLFPENIGNKTTYRKLKSLVLQKLLQRVDCENASAFTLGPAGIGYLNGQGRIVTRVGLEKRILKTALAISEFHLNLELALQHHPLVRLHRFVSNAEISTYLPGNFSGRQKYKIFHTIPDPIQEIEQIVYPHAMFILQARRKKGQRLFFLELDQGGSFSWMSRKMGGYKTLQDIKAYTKYGKFNSFGILFVADSAKRALNLRKKLANQMGTDFVWITDTFKIYGRSLVDQPIWLDHRFTIEKMIRSN